MTMSLPETYFLQLALRKGTTLHLNGAFFTMSWKCVIVNGDASPTITRTIYFTLVKDGRTLFWPDGTQRIVTMEEPKYRLLFHAQVPAFNARRTFDFCAKEKCQRLTSYQRLSIICINRTSLVRTAFGAERNGEFQSEKNCSLKRRSYLFARATRGEMFSISNTSAVHSLSSRLSRSLIPCVGDNTSHN